MAIWHGEHDHRAAYPGDGGIRFEARTAEERVALRLRVEQAVKQHREQLEALDRGGAAEPVTVGSPIGSSRQSD